MGSTIGRERSYVAGSRWNRFVGRNVRKSVACVLLMSFCCAILPIPVPSLNPPAENNSERFPCQSSGCGCKTAEQCWTHCCCYTPTQRLEWAKRNKVTPPSYAVLSEAPTHAASTLREWIRGVAARAKSESHCCDHSKLQKVASMKKTISTKSISKCSKCAESKSNRVVASQKSPGNSYTLTMLALKCQGKSSAFMQLPWFFPALRVETCSETVGSEPYLSLPSRVLISIYEQPDTPPPKMLSV